MARAVFRARCAINSINIRTTDAIARYLFSHHRLTRVRAFFRRHSTQMKYKYGLQLSTKL